MTSVVRRSPARLFAAFCAAVALAACESSVTPTNEGPLAAIRIGPPAALELENTVKLDVVLTDASGAVISGPQIFWSSENTAIARVSATGEVTGVSVGTTRIAASAEGVSAVVNVTVIPRRVMRVTLTPDRLGLIAGESGPLTVALLDGTNRALEGRPVEWRSSDAAIATVDNRGMVTARGEGSAQITATSEGVSGGATVLVARRPVSRIDLTPSQLELLVGQTQPFSATARAADGSVLDGRQVTWSSSYPGVATVSGSGVVTAVDWGQTTITATIEDKSASAVVTVSVAPVATVELSPTSAQLVVGGTQQITATLKAAGGQTLAGRPITWSSSTPAVATVSGSGLVTAVDAGQTTITATSEGKSATADITVRLVPVATVEVTPTSAQMVQGTVRQFAAAAKDASGNPLAGRAVAWSSDFPTIATVSDDGVVTAVAAGQAIITATIEGKSASSALTVVPVAVGSVEVTPSATDVSIGSTVQLTATPKSATGNPLTGRVITWTSSAPATATVNGTGVVTGVALGQATITATSEGRSGAAVVTVKVVAVATVEVTPSSATLPPTQTRQLSATTRDANGNLLTGRSVSWSSSNSLVATVNASGLVTAVAPGQATITATSEGKTDTAQITVSPAVATVEVTPGSSSLLPTQTRQLTATTKDATGNVLTGRTVTWSSGNTQVATVSTSGLVTAVAAGSATITATSEGKSGNASVTVLVPVATVDVSPTSASVAVNATRQFTATMRDAAGAVLTGRTVTWTSSNPSVATVSSSGLATGLSAGQATITATSEGKSDGGALTVTALPVATVEVSPSAATLSTGQTQQFSATLKASDGTVLTGRTVTWSSDKPQFASVSGAGVVTAVAPGSAKITATSEGKHDDANVTVQVPVATVQVSPTSATVAVGATRQFTATVRDANNNVLTGRVVTWSSSTPSVATVNGGGLATGVAGGQASIIATSEGRSGSGALTVTAPLPVATVEVSPTSVSMQVAQTRQLSVTLKAADGTVLTGRTVTWSSSNPLVASVSSSGLVTALLAGSATITATSEGRSGSSSVSVTLEAETTAASVAERSRR